jgi:hypothetical protein
MFEKKIQVKVIDGREDKWEVVFQGKNDEISVKMPSREDAVRYARVCEQRTGNEVLLPK